MAMDLFEKKKVLDGRDHFLLLCEPLKKVKNHEL
jgi:hypothetical protein